MTDFTIKRALGAVVATGALVAVPMALATGTASAQGHDWSGVAQCESGGNWNTNTGNGFSGGLQFTPSTWAAYGGTGNAADASQAEQIRVAENVLAGQGAGAWPVCGQYLTAGTTAAGYETTVSDVAEPVLASAPVASTPAVSAPAPAGGTYVVVSGDTLSGIAAAHGVSVDSLAGQVQNVDLIFPGQTLSV
ncbi:LysM peptidoglycan-binding domain-containing protein [Rhodococcus tukisamuensis]|uniref:LysM domain-containing protein n=1 Tax=Rhodococcus tukisamuensis TaxID=168276 RepID=A0A1G6QZI2_9NOCA|nr:transglycosylase family protein [Rhodococcus tukisamuensis]SDC97603.1 LysM domain-containing protein [Rhodococcus tukisamuensis]